MKQNLQEKIFKPEKKFSDKRRLKNRYSYYLKNLNIKELHRIYNFDKQILNLIFESKIKSFKGRLHTDYWLIIIFNLIKIKIFIYFKKFKNQIKKGESKKKLY